MITQNELKQLLNYDPVTGEFTWSVTKTNSATVGARAGGLDKVNGYRQLMIDGKRYLEHRLAWLYVYGYLPTKQIDHRNGIKDNNWIDNLREATGAENNQNVGKRKHNTSGFMGVVKSGNKWRAQIGYGSETRYLGLFNTPELAYEAYLKAKSELHTFQPEPRL